MFFFYFQNDGNQTKYQSMVGDSSGRVSLLLLPGVQQSKSVKGPIPGTCSN